MRALTLLLVWTYLSGAAAPIAPSAQGEPEAIAQVRAFAERYQREAPSLVAHEYYIQNATYSRGTPARRELTSELVMVRLPGTAGWVSFRDVLTVNNRRIPDREERLLKLLQSPDANALAQAQKIAQESARYNLGRISRTMNVPDVVLEYLQPRHADRIAFDAPRTDVIDRVPVVVLRFRETKGPSIIRNFVGADLRANGRVWAEPESGTIVRTELVLEDRGSRGTCTVEFGSDPRLAIRVPIKMTERYVTTGESIDAVATYSDFRSFTVSTTEKVTKPPGR